MDTGRWRIELVEEHYNLPARWHRDRRATAPSLPSGEYASAALLGAFHLLARRGPGSSGWATSFRHDPIAFVLDTTDDAINLWGSTGDLLYQNRAAADLGIGRSDEAPLESFAAGGKRFERRCLRCHLGGADYILEVIHERRSSDHP